MIHKAGPDVIISGGGMVGLSLAIACAKVGVTSVIIEKNPPSYPQQKAFHYSPRVSAINLASETFLTNLGIWQRIPTSRRSPYTRMQVWDGLGQGVIDFEANEVQKPHLGHIIENSMILDAAWQCAYESDAIEVITEDAVQSWEEDAQSIHIHTQQGHNIVGKVLVGCEGKYSPLREKSTIGTWQWDYHHVAIVTTIEHEKPHQLTARQTFLETGPLAFLPLHSDDPNRHFSSIVWSIKSDQAHAILDLPDADFLQQLERAFEHKLGKLLHTQARFSFPLTAQQAKTYFEGRLVVLGDAAHTIHPLAGLGVNLGFLDAATLAESWGSARINQIDLGHNHVLRRFQRQRQPHNLAVAGLMEGLKRIFDTQASAPVLLRNTGLQILNESTLLKRPLILGALGEFGTPLPELCR